MINDTTFQVSDCAEGGRITPFLAATHRAHKERQMRINAAGVRHAAKLEQQRETKQAEMLDRYLEAVKKPAPTIEPPAPTREGIPLQIITVQGAVADKFGLKRADLTGPKRTDNVVKPRFIAIYLCRKLTTRSLPDIGRRFGGRDHTTILHSISRVEDWIRRDAVTAQVVADLTEALS